MSAAVNAVLRKPMTLQGFLTYPDLSEIGVSIPLADLYTGLALEGGSAAAQ